MSNLIIVLFLFVFTGISAFVEPGLNKDTRRKLYILVSVIIVIFVGLRDGSSLNDYGNYVRIYNDLTRRSEVEFSYNVICSLAGSLGGVSVMFFIYALLGTSTKLFAFYRLTDLKFLTLAIYVSNIMILHDMTQMRAGVASGIFLLALPYLCDRKVLKYLLLVALAFCFHYSSLLFLIPCLFWIKSLRDNRWFYLLIIPIGYLLGTTVLNPEMIPYEPIKAKILMYRNLQQMGSTGFPDLNIFNPYILFRIAIYFILLWKFNLIKRFNRYFQVLMFIEGLAICLFPAFSSIALLGYRGSELLGIVEVVLYPMLYYAIKPKTAAKFSVISIAAALLIVNLTYKHLIYF